jgi:hypothetical protein
MRVFGFTIDLPPEDEAMPGTVILIRPYRPPSPAGRR